MAKSKDYKEGWRNGFCDGSRRSYTIEWKNMELARRVEELTAERDKARTEGFIAGWDYGRQWQKDYGNV